MSNSSKNPREKHEVRTKEAKHLIENAEQQLTGFAQGYYFGNIINLISSMGLKEYEWKYLKRNKLINCLEKDLIKEVNDYFKEEASNG